MTGTIFERTLATADIEAAFADVQVIVAMLAFEAALADCDDARIREQAYKDGMKPLRVSGAMKVAAGVTSADEVLKVAPLG